MAVKVVTDSVADLPPQVAEELGITVVPINVRFGEEVYRDGIDLTADEFYEKLKHSKTLPVTSVPSPKSFAEAYDKLAGEADGILTIVLSSKLSGTYDVALQSIGLMKRKCRVEVIDSQWAIMAQGFTVMAAARAARAGADLDEVMAVAQRNISRVDLRGALDTLEYLKRGGRIGPAAAFLGSMLRIHPIISMKDGIAHPVARERSRGKAIDHLYNFAMSYSHIEEMAVEDGACPDDAERLVERLSCRFPKERIYRSRTTPVIGTHTGPGLLVLDVLGDR